MYHILKENGYVCENVFECALIFAKNTYGGCAANEDSLFKGGQAS